MKTKLLTAGALILAATLGACAGSNSGNNNSTGSYDSNCEASNESGLFLTSLGSYDYDISRGATVALKTMVVHLDDGSGNQGGVVPGVAVSFDIISVVGDGELSANQAVTSAAGVASVEFTATEAGTYQVTASAEGTCAVTFSVSVVNQLRSLRVISNNPLITETGRRISISVQAYSPDPGHGEYPLVGEDITYTLLTSGTEAVLSDITGQQSGDTVVVQTGPSGIATVQMETGTQVVSGGVDVQAELADTGPEIIEVRIQGSGSTGCSTNADCPISYPVCDGGVCVASPSSGGACQSDADCVAPYECDEAAGECRVPSGGDLEPCNAAMLNPCPSGETCIGGYCTPVPGDDTPCTTNDDCPTGWLCVDGICQPDGDPGDPPCDEITNPCPGGTICVDGVCIPGGDCPNPQPTDRLQGTWDFDSTLHLRDALGGFADAIFSAAEFLRDIILGDLDIPGVPSLVEDFVEAIVQGVIDSYIPPWGQDFIVAMGDISDIIDDMRVYSTVNLIPMGNYEYLGSSTWDIVEFEYRGQYISEDPANIPQIGAVHPEDFTSREICGVFYIDRHHVDNVVGGLIRWAIEAALTAVTCSVPGWPCYYSLEDALHDLVDCYAIADAIDDLVYNAFGLDVWDTVYDTCDMGVTQAIDAILRALDDLTVRLSLMSMRGRADISSDTVLTNGRWYGSLAGGSYDGEFEADKQ